MKLAVHLMNMTWPGGAAQIGPVEGFRRDCSGLARRCRIDRRCRRRADGFHRSAANGQPGLDRRHRDLLGRNQGLRPGVGHLELVRQINRDLLEPVGQP